MAHWMALAAICVWELFASHGQHMTRAMRKMPSDAVTHVFSLAFLADILFPLHML